MELVLHRAVLDERRQAECEAGERLAQPAVLLLEFVQALDVIGVRRGNLGRPAICRLDLARDEQGRITSRDGPLCWYLHNFGGSNIKLGLTAKKSELGQTRHPSPQIRRSLLKVVINANPAHINYVRGFEC